MLDILLSGALGICLGAVLTGWFVFLKLQSKDPERKFELPSFPDFPKKKAGRVIRDMDKRTYEIENRESKREN